MKAKSPVPAPGTAEREELIRAAFERHKRKWPRSQDGPRLPEFTVPLYAHGKQPASTDAFAIVGDVTFAVRMRYHAGTGQVFCEGIEVGRFQL